MDFDLTQPSKSKRLPYYLQSKQTDPTPVRRQRKDDKGQTVDYTIMVPQSSVIDIVADPAEPVKVGDRVYNTGFGYPGSYFEVTAVSEPRPAKGDFTSYGFIPVWQQISVKFQPN